MSEPTPGPPTAPEWPSPPAPAPEAARPLGWPPAPGAGEPPVPPAPPKPPPPARSGRRMLAVLALIVVVGALLAWGIFNWSSAADWRDRSKASEARLADRVDRLEETRNELADTEERLADVASEKANVADEREVLQQIVADAPDVTEALRDCNDATADVAAVAIELSGSPNPDFTLLDEAIDDADLLCSEALDQADELEETIDDLDL